MRNEPLILIKDNIPIAILMAEKTFRTITPPLVIRLKFFFLVARYDGAERPLLDAAKERRAEKSYQFNANI